MKAIRHFQSTPFAWTVACIPFLGVAIAVFGTGCASRDTNGSATVPVELLFKGESVLAKRGQRTWLISEVHHDQMLWAPDGEHFAYVKQLDRSRYQIVVRNARGDSVNTFPVYRPGKPTALDWIDDNKISYMAPPDKTGPAFVVHDVRSAQIRQVIRGTQFTWSPGRRRLAYVVPVTLDSRRFHDKIRTVEPGQQPIQRDLWNRGAVDRPSSKSRHCARQLVHAVNVDDQRIWPRTQTEDCSAVGHLSWSPDGQGLAFIEVRRKHHHLVVLLAIDDADHDLTWRIPAHATSRKNRVFWAKNRVIVGENALKPRFAASWTIQ